jgi:hypothetical protein
MGAIGYCRQPGGTAKNVDHITTAPTTSPTLVAIHGKESGKPQRGDGSTLIIHIVRSMTDERRRQTTFECQYIPYTITYYKAVVGV